MLLNTKGKKAIINGIDHNVAFFFLFLLNLQFCEFDDSEDYIAIVGQTPILNTTVTSGFVCNMSWFSEDSVLQYRPSLSILRMLNSVSKKKIQLALRFGGEQRPCDEKLTSIHRKGDEDGERVGQVVWLKIILFKLMER